MTGIICLILFTCQVFQNANGQKILLTIDEEPVTEEEFIFHMKPLRALTYSYFYTKYGASQGTGFWTTIYSGESPLRHIENKAIRELVGIKVHLTVAKELGLAEDLSFNGFLEDLRQENKQRMAAMMEGEIIYGPLEYTEESYFSYWFSNINIRMRDAWGMNQAVSHDSIFRYYLQHEKDYRSSDELILTWVSIPYNEISERDQAVLKAEEWVAGCVMDSEFCIREDIRYEDLVIPENITFEAEGFIAEIYRTAGQMQPGQCAGPFIDILNRQIILLICKERRTGTLQPFEQVINTVLRQYRDEKFQQYMDERMADANVVKVAHNMDEILLRYLK